MVVQETGLVKQTCCCFLPEQWAEAIYNPGLLCSTQTRAQLATLTVFKSTYTKSMQLMPNRLKSSWQWVHTHEWNPSNHKWASSSESSFFNGAYRDLVTKLLRVFMNDLKENTSQFLAHSWRRVKIQGGGEDKHNCGCANYLSHLELPDKKGSSELQ